MTTVVPADRAPVFTDEPIFRLTVDQYHQLIESGSLGESEPVELVEGVLLQKMTRHTPHATSVRRCRRVFTPVLPAGFFYDSEQAVTLDDGEPEPDGAVIRGEIDDYADRHPGPAEIALLIEVAESTLARDRGIKLRSYARARILAYWIVNLIDRRVEVYSDPDPTAHPHPTYRRRQVYSGDDPIPVSVGGIELPPVDASSAILPPAESR